MTQLSDTQAIILSAAAQRTGGNLLPLPGSLRGGAAVKVVGALLARGLAREEVIDRTIPAVSALNTVWRNEDDGRAVLLKVTPEGLAAIGVEPAAAAGELEAEPAGDAPRKKRGRPKKAAASSTSAPTASHKPRPDTKQAQLITMLRRKQGATIAQIVEATGWQAHTIRGAFAGALKRKLGLTVTSKKVEGRERVYRIT